jgi:hypothetical protein
LDWVSEFYSSARRLRRTSAAAKCWKCAARGLRKLRDEGGEMPWFYFDLMIDNHPRDQGGMILEDTAGARDRANALAHELRIARPELQGKGCFIRVTDEDAKEVHRTPVDMAPAWSIHTVQK